MIYKAYTYRIYPTLSQRKLFAQFFGCVRFVYNFFLTMKQQEYSLWYKSPTKKACSAELTKLKAEKGYEWLNDCDSTALQSSLENLDKAFKKLFEGGGYPKYKSKKDHKDSYTTKNNCNKNGNNSIELAPKKIKLPKAGWVKTKVSRPTEGRILSATVSRTPSGKYFVSVLCEVPEVYPVREEQEVQKGMDVREVQGNPVFRWSLKDRKAVSLDLGIVDYIVAHDGTGTYSVPNPKNLDKTLKKLAHEQRVFSRKTSGSRRFERQRVKVARIHEDVTNQRNDLLQKLSTAIVMAYDIICVEDLDIKGLIKQIEEDEHMTAREKHTRIRHIEDSAWGTFVNMLAYKCKWYGKTLVKVGRYYPSTQLCSKCGTKNPAVKDTRVREWTCPTCGAHHGRDENAAKNILKEGLRVYDEALKQGVAVFGAVITADELKDLTQATA